MDEEGVRNFKELRAKFQKLDALPLPRANKFPATVSQKDDVEILVNGKPLLSNQCWPPSSCSSDEFQTPKSQKTKSTQRSEIQKRISSLGPSEKSTVCPVENSQKASLLIDMNRSNANVTEDEKEKMNNSFRDKLRKWEDVLSQKSQVSSADLLTNGRDKVLLLEGQKAVALGPERPRKKIVTKEAQTLSSKLAQRKSLAAPEDPLSLHSQFGRKSQERPNSAGHFCKPANKCELTGPTPERRPEVRRDQHPKTKPLPSVGYLGPPPPKPPKPPVVNLRGFQRQPEAISSSHQEVTMREASHPPESAEFEEPHNYEATISCLSHSDESINLGTAEEIADSTYEVEIEELPKPWETFLHREPGPEPEDGDKNQAEEEPRKVEPQAAAKDLDPKRPVQVGVCSGTPGNMPTTGAHGDQWSLPGGTQETTSSGIINTNVCSQDMKLAWPPQSQGVCVQALEASEDTPVSGLLNTSPVSEEMYDDVDCTRSKWDFSNSLASESEGNSEEMYEDIYKTSNNFPKAESDGKEALQRFQQFFQKGKDRFKMKIKPKEHLSAFSISLPDLALGSQDTCIYDDVDTSGRASKDEDKMKFWKTKFLIRRGKKERKAVDGSESIFPRNFFRAKLPNLEKIRMGREEKLFRERFQYDKEIAVINRAVACSSNSGGGALDLPITPGEELDVIDTTEQNLVICRNSKGKCRHTAADCPCDFNPDFNSNLKAFSLKLKISN